MDKILSSLSRKKYLIFDLDGTIVKLKINWTGWHKGVAEIFHRYDRNFVWAGERVDSLTKSYIEKYGTTMRNEIIDFMTAYELNNPRGYSINQCLVNYILKNENQENSLLTNNISNTVYPILKDLKLENRFKIIITPDKLTYMKPDIEGISKIINNRNISDFAVIGDGVFDEMVAKAQSIDFIKIEKNSF